MNEEGWKPSLGFKIIIATFVLVGLALYFLARFVLPDIAGGER